MKEMFTGEFQPSYVCLCKHSIPSEVLSIEPFCTSQLQSFPTHRRKTEKGKWSCITFQLSPHGRATSGVIMLPLRGRSVKHGFDSITKVELVGCFTLSVCISRSKQLY